MFSYQGSLLFFSSDSFYILSEAFHLVKNFFIFLSLSAARSLDSSYMLSHQRFHVKHFFYFSLPGRSASASPAKLPSFVFFMSLISDRCYLTTLGRNCQCFFSFLFISDNSDILTRQFSQPERARTNHTCMNQAAILMAEGAPFYEQSACVKQALKRVSARLRMARAERKLRSAFL